MSKIFANYRIPAQGLSALQKIHDQLEAKGLTGQYQMLHRSHITVAFYGEVDNAYEPELVKRIQDAIKDIPPFEIKFSKVKEFDNPDNRVIWLSVEPEGGLAKLHEAISFPDIDQYKFDEYHPHITLILNASQGDYDGIDVPDITLTVDAVTLSAADDDRDYRVAGVAHLANKRETVSRLRRKGRLN